MKAKKFIDKAVDAIEDWLIEQGISDHYTIYWKLKNGEPILKLMYSDGSIHKYNLESYRLLHKESDISFKKIVEQIINEQIVDEMLAYERQTTEIQQAAEELEEREVSHVLNLNKELLTQNLIAFLAENQYRITAAGLFADRFMARKLTINGVSKEVLIPDLRGLNDCIDPISFATLFPIPILEIGNIEEVFSTVCDEKLDRLYTLYLNRLFDEPVTGLEAIFKSDVQNYIYSRFMSPNEFDDPMLQSSIKSVVIDGDDKLYETYGIRLSNGSFMDIEPWMTSPPEFSFTPALGDMTVEQIQQKAHRNQHLEISELSPNICVVTNTNCRFGASAFLDADFPAIIQSRFHTQEVLIIPSSVHECIVTPDTEEMRKIFTGLPQIVNERLNPNEVLYDKVLQFNLSTREITPLDTEKGQEQETEGENDVDYDAPYY